MEKLKRIQHLPGPPPVLDPVSIFKTIQQYNNDRIGMSEGFLDRYGRVMQVRVAHRVRILVSDPEWVQEVLVTKASSFGKDFEYSDPYKGVARYGTNGILTSNGDAWKRQRKQIAPAFQAKRIQEYAQTVTALTADTLRGWETRQAVDLLDEITSLTLRITGQTMFATDIGDNVKTVDAIMRSINKTVGEYSILPNWAPTLRERRAREAIRNIDAYIYPLMTERRQQLHVDSAAETQDVLSALLLWKDENGQPMTDQRIRDQVITLYLAGYESTTNTLCWAFYELSKSPEVEAKLHAEVDSVLGGRPPTFEDLPQLPYTENVFKEAMRRYPSVPNIGRRALEEVEVAGYRIPKDTSITIAIHRLQNDPAYWQAPQTFLPGRFSEGAEGHPITPYTYLPFGAGPRMCTGSNIGLMQGSLILASIAQRYRLTIKPGHVVEPRPRITFHPGDTLPMALHPRLYKR